MPRDFAFEETLTPAPFNEASALARIPAVRRPGKADALKLPMPVTDLGRTWPARMDEHERSTRQEFFRQTGKTPGEADRASGSMAGIVVLLAIVAVTAGTIMLGYEAYRGVVEARQNYAAEAVAKGRW